MLRLINADPSLHVTLEQHRSDGVHEDVLRYNLPAGVVLQRFSTKVPYEGYPPVVVDALIARADEPLESDPNLDNRENGLLVVDDRDVVYDLTLFEFDKTPGLERIFGIVRLTGFRAVAYDRLQNHNEAVVTETRDGLDRRHTFTKQLYTAMNPHLAPILRAEQKRLLESETEFSKEERERVDKAMGALNSLFTAETGERGKAPGDSGFEVPDFSTVMFVPDRITLHVGVQRSVHLLAKRSAVRLESTVIVETDNPDIVIEPDSTSFGKAQEVASGVFSVGFRVISSVPGASGRIAALVEGDSGQSHTADLFVSDVQTTKEIAVPDEGMEFRPSYASASPHRKGVVVLYIDTSRVPFKSEIDLRLDDTGSIRLLTEDGTEITATVREVRRADLVQGSCIAKIPVYFRGHGKGQQTALSAKTKIKGGGKFTAAAQVMIKDPASADKGMFRDVRFGPIGKAKFATIFDKESGIIWINSRHPTNAAFFGPDERTYRKKLESDRACQIRRAELILDEAMYEILAHKLQLTGEKGWSVKEGDPVGSIRTEIEKWKFDDGPEVYRALVDDFRTEPREGYDQ